MPLLLLLPVGVGLGLIFNNAIDNLTERPPQIIGGGTGAVGTVNSLSKNALLLGGGYVAYRVLKKKRVL